MRTRSQLLRSWGIREAVFLALVLGIALFLYLLVRSMVRTDAGGLVFTPISGITALIVVPGCWLYIVRATWPAFEAGSFWGTYGYISVLEMAVASGLVYLVRKQATWRGTLVFALHFVFWLVLVLVVGHGNFLAPIAVSIPLSLVFPCSGFVWLRYIRTLHANQSS